MLNRWPHLAALGPEQLERFSPVLEEFREALAASRQARTHCEDARQTMEVSLRLANQAVKDQDRAKEHVRRALELLGIEE
jgi:exonuclease VII small subunit